MKIFISSSESKIAGGLAESLRMLWHDVQTSEQATWEETFQAILSCDVLLFVATPESLDSFCCQLELDYAAALNTRILPVWAAAIDPTDLRPELKVIPGVFYCQPVDIEQVRDALSHLPMPLPRLRATPLYPNVFQPLADLRAQAANPPRDLNSQIRLMHNLQAFMNRQETFATARNILQSLRKHKDAALRVKQEIKVVAEPLLALHLSALKRQMVMAGSGLCATVAAVFLLGNALVIPNEALDTYVPLNTVSTIEVVGASTSQNYFVVSPHLPTQTSIPPTITPSPTFTLTATYTPSPTATGTPSSTPTITPTLTSTVTPTFTPTFTITPSSTSTVTPSPQPSATATLNPTSTPTLRPTLESPVYTGIRAEDREDGVIVTGISQQVAGVQVGDQVLGVDMQLVSSSADFYAVLSAYQPFSNVMLRLRRGEADVYIQVSLAVVDFAVPSGS